MTTLIINNTATETTMKFECDITQLRIWLGWYVGRATVTTNTGATMTAQSALNYSHVIVGDTVTITVES